MANRFPLVLDTTDNNKIKEIQNGDNLDLTGNSVVGVQNITANGTIDAADITVNGNRLVAQSFADLTDTPANFNAAANYFVKVNADGNGLEFRPLSDLGNIEIDTITVDTSIVPSSDNSADIGTPDLKFNQVVANTFKGNLRSFAEEVVFDAYTGKISYAALQGAPQFLSEFTNDVGYLRTADLDTSLASLFDEGVPFSTDIIGSVFGDDSTILVDAVGSVVVGNVDNAQITTIDLVSETAQLTTTTATTITGPETGNLTIDSGTSGVIDIGANSERVNVSNAVIESFSQGTGLGIAQIQASTDLEISAGNRVKLAGGIPFRFARTSTADQQAIAASEGDVIYNTTTSRLQMYQGGAWKDINGNVEATAGTSNFNDIIVAGDLTVQGTTTSVETTNTTISDNVITLNSGETLAGVGGGTGNSGIEVDRGTEANVSFVWDETLPGWTAQTEDVYADGFRGNGFFGALTGDVTGNVNGNVTGDLTGTVYGTLIGTHTGDVVGSVFADDSGIMVDAVSNKLNATNVNTDTITSNSTLGITAGAAIVARATDMNIGATAGPLYLSSNGSAVTLSGDSGAGSIVYDDSTGNIDLGTTGTITIQGAATSPINIGTGTSGTVTLGNGSNTVGFTSGTTVDFDGATVSNLTANIDNTTLDIGATAATTINIGNATSTTNIDGTVSFGSALVANNITADDSIIIQTEGNSASEAITIFPQGSDTAINLRADAIRLFGTPFTDSLAAQGGIVGDIKGSVVGDDSTVLVDGVGNKIVGDIESTNIHGQAFKADTIVNNTVSTLDITAGTFLNLYGGAEDAGVSNIQMDKNGINYIELNTEPSNPADPADVANIAINANVAGGDVVIGSATSSRNQVVTVYNADITGTLTGSVTGTLTGDIVGSVFADDSAPMVNAVDRTMFSDVMTLTPLNAEPDSPISGTLVAADGVGWDPASKAGGVSYPVFYDGSSWNALY